MRLNDLFFATPQIMIGAKIQKKTLLASDYLRIIDYICKYK